MAVRRDIGINVRVRTSGADELSRAKKELQEMRTVLRLAAENARKLGRENDRLEKEIRDVRRELGKAEKALRRFEKSGKGVAGLAKRFANLKTIIAGLAVLKLREEWIQLIDTLADFSARMSAVQAVSGATAAQMKALTAQAREMGETTSFSASQAAEAQEFFARAGFKVNEIMGALPPTLNLAKAGALGLGEAADISSNILSAFGASAAELPRFIDAIAASAANSNTNVLQMGEAMKQVAPIAASLGIPVEQVAAAIGILGNAGIQGEAGGNALKVILASLVNPSSQAKAALADLGLTMEDIDPATKSLAEIVAVLTEKNLGAGEAFQIFGRRGAPAILALTKQVPQLRELNEVLEENEGTTARMAKTMGDNLKGDIDRFKSAAEGARLTVGEGLTPALRDLLRQSTETLGESAGLWRGLGRILGTVALALGAIVELIGGPIQAAVGIVSDLAAAVGRFIGGDFATGLERLKSIGPEIVDSFADTGEGVGKKLDALGEVWKTTGKEFEDGGSKIKDRGKDLKEVGTAAGEAADQVEDAGGRMKDGMTSAGEGVDEVETKLSGLPPAAQAAADGVSDAASRTGTAYDGAADAIAPAVERIKELMGIPTAAAQENAAALTAAWESFDTDALTERFKKFSEDRQRALRDEFLKDVEAIKKAGGEISSEMQAVGRSIGILVSSTGQAFDLMGDQMFGLTDRAREMVDEVNELITGLPANAEEAAKDLAAAWESFDPNALRQRLAGASQAVREELRDKFREDVEAIKAAGGDITAEMQAVGNAMGVPVAQYRNVSRAAKEAEEAMRAQGEAASGAADTNRDAGEAAGELSAGLEGVGDAGRDAAAGVDAAGDSAKGSGDKIREGAKGAEEAAEKFGSVAEKVGEGTSALGDQAEKAGEAGEKLGGAASAADAVGQAQTTMAEGLQKSAAALGEIGSGVEALPAKIQATAEALAVLDGVKLTALLAEIDGVHNRLDAVLTKLGELEERAEAL